VTGSGDRSTFFSNWTRVITEIGERYGGRGERRAGKLMPRTVSASGITDPGGTMQDMTAPREIILANIHHEHPPAAGTDLRRGSGERHARLAGIGGWVFDNARYLRKLENYLMDLALYGMKVFLHSCGMNWKLVDDLLDCGIDCFQFDQPAVYDRWAYEEMAACRWTWGEGA
jgi:hypothetical protein